MNSWMFSNKELNFSTTMNLAAVPQKDDVTTQEFDEMLKETLDIRTSEVVRAKLEVEGDSFSFWRYRKGVNGRNAVLFVKVIKQWSLSSGGPSSFDIWDKQKPRFIKENQVGTKFLGLFLYGAICNASIAQSLFRSFEELAVPVSDSSSPFLKVFAKHDWGDTELETVPRLNAQFAEESTGRWSNHTPEVLPKVTSPTSSSVREKVLGDDQEWDWGEDHSSPSFCKSDTNGKLNSWTLQANELLPTDFCPLLTTGWPVGDASPVVERFLGVSCNIV